MQNGRALAAQQPRADAYRAAVDTLNPTAPPTGRCRSAGPHRRCFHRISSAAGGARLDAHVRPNAALRSVWPSAAPATRPSPRSRGCGARPVWPTKPPQGAHRSPGSKTTKPALDHAPACAEIQMPPALGLMVVDLELAAGLPTATANPPATPQPNGHDHPLCTEADIDHRRAGQAQQPVECGHDAHVALLRRRLNFRHPAACRRERRRVTTTCATSGQILSRESPAQGANAARWSPPTRPETGKLGRARIRAVPRCGASPGRPLGTDDQPLYGGGDEARDAARPGSAAEA